LLSRLWARRIFAKDFMMSGVNGGRRPGAGAKPKNAALRSIDGGASKAGAFPGDSGAVIAPIQMFEPAEDLPLEVRQVWMDLASFCFQNRTLTRATELSFVLLCRNIVLERQLAEKEPGSPGHRGMIQRVDAELLRFNLAPCGKPMYELVQEKPVSPLERFLKRQA
jgi:hypothetical protein